MGQNGITGSGTVNYSVTANTGGPRVGSIVVASIGGGGTVFTITQDAANNCFFTLSSISGNFPTSPGSGNFAVTASQPTCAWTASSDSAFATITSGNSGTGNGTVNFTVASNTSGGRTANITVANTLGSSANFAATQAGAFTCSFTLTPTSVNFTNAGGTGTIGATQSFSFCLWTAQSNNPDAVTLGRTSGGFGTTLTYTVAQNTGPDRVLTITFGCQTFTIFQGGTAAGNPVPVVTTLAPPSIPAAGPNFTLTVNGSSFVNGATVLFNGLPRVTTFVNVGQLTAAILASDIPFVGTASVVVTNPVPGGGVSNSVNYSITGTNPVPVITTIAPTSVPTGSPAFTLTVNGTGFSPNSVVSFGGAAKTTSFVSTTQLTAAILATDVATGGTPAVIVTNPTPGGGPSNSVTFNVISPVVTITSLSPTTVAAGSGSLVLSVFGTNFVNGATVNFGASAEPTLFENSGFLIAVVAATDIANPGTPAITVTNPGGAPSNSLTFTITGTGSGNPLPSISALSPTGVTAGSGAFTLTVTGANFVSGATVNFNGTARTTTFGSATQLTASISAADVAAAGTPAVSVTNPTPGGGTSNSINFNISAANNPVPAITSLVPNNATAGGPGFSLIVNGTNFISTSTVNFNGSSRATTFNSGTQLTATISAADIATAGTASITATNPAPGGGTSAAATLTINNPVPTLATLSPTSATAGSAAFTLTITGTNFVNGATVSFGGVTRAATLTNSTQLTTQIQAADVANAGTPAVTVTNPTPGGGTSNSVNFSVNTPANPVPTISSLSPTGVVVGSGALALTVTGTNFISSSTVNIGGAPRATTFVNSTQLTAAILSTDVTSVGTPAITVTNPTPGGGTSNSVNFNISAAPNPVPTVTTLSPTNVIAGSGAFTLTVNGTNFLNSSVVNFGGAARTTTFVNSTQVTAAILVGDVASAGTPSVTVTNPAPGGGPSNAVTFAVNNPQPNLTSMTPNTVSAGSAGFTITVNGSGFINSSVVQWNGNVRTTTFVSTTQLTAAITAADVQTASSVNVSVRNPAPGGGNSLSLQFSVTTPIPVLGSLVPNSAIAGGAAFTLTVNGSNLINTSVVQWNGSTRATTFVSATQLMAAITAADIATVGTSSVTVFTPAVNLGGGANPLGAPSGITSNALTFAINAPNPVPTLTSISPATIGAGGAAFTLTLTGTNFINGSTAQWKGSARTTTFVSATQLTAAITSADIAASGTAAITVVNPTPGGGTSNSLTLTITDFSVSATTTTQTVTAGASANFTIATATVGGAFPGAVTFTASGLPIGASATFNPSSVSASTSTTMSVTTTARTLSQIKTPPFQRTTPLRQLWLIAFAMLLVLTVFASAVKFGRGSPRRLASVAAFAMLLVAVGYISGCSGGGFPSVRQNTGTPAGTYTITVTGTSGAVQHTTSVTLLVQ